MRTEIVSAADGTVRGTQSFVHTLSECWRRPSLTALEVAWRWVFGIPALLLLWKLGTRILQEAPLNVPALRAMTVLDPMRAAETLAEAMAVLLPPVSRVAVWLVPLLLVTWVVWSSLGRTVVLRRVDSSAACAAVDADGVAGSSSGGAGWELCGVVLCACSGRRR